MDFSKDDQQLYEECVRGGAHRFFALEPDFEEIGGVKLIYLACTACGYLKLHELKLKKHAT